MQLNFSHRGYTLIELLVSLSIFAIVMLAATAAYLSFINYNRIAQTKATVVNSLYFSLDSMARDIRTGTQYSCSGGCTTSGNTTLNFVDDDGCSVSYTISASAIKRTEGSGTSCTPQANVAVTDPSVTVTSLKFYVRGASAGDETQPAVTIVVQGEAAVPNSTTVIPFDVQTTATERIPDI